MLAFPSLTHRHEFLESLVREALLTKELSTDAEGKIRHICQQPDLTSGEVRILEILHDALSHGYIRYTHHN